jgi:hypothetical protein
MEGKAPASPPRAGAAPREQELVRVRTGARCAASARRSAAILLSFRTASSVTTPAIACSLPIDKRIANELQRFIPT